MRLLLFDYDGVIADTFADMLTFAQETCEELGVSHTVVPADLSKLEVMSFATFGRACEVPEPLLDEFVGKSTRRFAEKVKPPAIFDGLAEVIRGLSERNILAIVTGNTSGNVNAFLAHHRLQGCFRGIYGVDMPGSKVEKIKLARREFETGRNLTWFVGDSLSDIRAAREAGVKSIAVGWGHQSLNLLLCGKPDMVVHSSMELMQLVDEG